MIVPIVLYGQPVLRKKAPDVADPGAEQVRQLVENLVDTMRAAPGIGLAAPQIGVSLQVAVVDVTGTKDSSSRMRVNGAPVKLDAHMPLVLINPRVTGVKTKEVDTEGCLSIPRVAADVPRSARVKVQTRTLEGGVFEFEADGLLARAIQHEVDHLNGKLFIDLLPAEERRELKPLLDVIEGDSWLPGDE